jgi:heme-degrading monooxygenase HmoA
MSETVTLINAFSVPADKSERFLHRWKDTARMVARQRGLIGARLYQCPRPDVELRFVTVAGWESRQALHAAMANPEWQASARRMLEEDLHVTARPELHDVAGTLRAGDTLS